jgi:HAD superfamily hydrolase (TIGR01509 family)
MTLSNISPPALVIFDCDGVLVDSETPMHDELRDELELRGLSMSFEGCISNFMGRSIEDVIATARRLGADLPDNWRGILYERVFERLRQGVDMIQGAPELVERLKRAGIPFCVASNGSEKKMQLMLSQHGLWDDFKDRCFSAHTIGIAKPDPGLLKFALHAMQTPARHAVVIEDSQTGVQSAINAEVPYLIYDVRNAIPDSQASQELKFTSIAEISDHLFRDCQVR